LIDLTVRQGDGYFMNAEMQQHYEHSVPVIKECESKRKVLIFRSGKLNTTTDNGQVTTSEPAPTRQRIWYGHPPISSGVSIGTTLHSRQDLADTNVHDNLLGGVCGNKEQGCSSIIVSNQNGNRYGDDKFRWLMYAAGKRQLGPSLIASYEKGYPVRVFRSSKCSQFAPPCAMVGRIRKTRYRYDGLYTLTDYCKVKDFFVFILCQVRDYDEAQIKLAKGMRLPDFSKEDSYDAKDYSAALTLWKMFHCDEATCLPDFSKDDCYDNKDYSAASTLRKIYRCDAKKACYDDKDYSAALTLWKMFHHSKIVWQNYNEIARMQQYRFLEYQQYFKLV